MHISLAPHLSFHLISRNSFQGSSKDVEAADVDNVSCSSLKLPRPTCMYASNAQIPGHLRGMWLDGGWDMTSQTTATSLTHLTQPFTGGDVMAPPVASYNQFCLNTAVMEGAAREIQFGYLDVGPTDSLPPDELVAAQETFFGNVVSSNAAEPTPTSQGSVPLETLTPTPTPPNPVRHPAGNSATRKRKLQSRARREERRREDNAKRPRYGEDVNVQWDHIAGASSTTTPYDVSKGPVASTAFVALPDSRGSVHTLEHLVGKLGFCYVEATEG